MSAPYHVGRTDGTVPKVPCTTQRAAEATLDAFQKQDPQGVANGEYYIDGPEPSSIDCTRGVPVGEVWKAMKGDPVAYTREVVRYAAEWEQADTYPAWLRPTLEQLHEAFSIEDNDPLTVARLAAEMAETAVHSPRVGEIPSWLYLALREVQQFEFPADPPRRP